MKKSAIDTLKRSTIYQNFLKEKNLVKKIEVRYNLVFFRKTPIFKKYIYRIHVKIKKD
ncbi:hypothetical protein SFC12_12185 [Lactococcus lactis]|uniref:hypothetical protein n=1 Tax=Lactococcus lactis TaxID=1358 RepID=UPI003981B9BC